MSYKSTKLEIGFRAIIYIYVYIHRDLEQGGACLHLFVLDEPLNILCMVVP